MCAVCKEERGQCRQWAVGRAARTDENPRVFAHAETQRVKSDQKSSAAGALWDRVGIVEIFETWFFNIPKPSLFGPTKFLQHPLYEHIRTGGRRNIDF